ncbi:hypothetical protein [Phenylobacterium sp.]|uniref:hypothetical protein n=1 Tax=Phenylobacterium sp. TaxID=1871053 RepID=UPI002F40374C
MARRSKRGIEISMHAALKTATDRLGLTPKIVTTDADVAFNVSEKPASISVLKLTPERRYVGFFSGGIC